ncbi:hypothetical protein [Burkholderia glumae]
MTDPNTTAALTDEQIDAIANDGHRNAAGGIYATSVHAFARDIERALLTSPRAADSPRGTSAQIQLERKLTCEAIDGVMASGYQNRNPPPSDEHWLAGFWKIGRSFFGAEFALRFIRDQLNEYLVGVPLDEASKKLRDVAQSAIDDFSVNPIVSIDLQAYMPECWIDIARRAAPAAPVAEPAPDPLRRRVERLLVELHAEGRLSEGQCAKMLDISRVDWRELAEFLSPDAQAVAADGAPEDEPSEIEQVIACLGDDAAQLRDANPDDEMADNMEAAARMLSERAALREMLDDARNEFTMVREALGVAYEPHQTLLERTLDAARASQAAAPARIEALRKGLFNARDALRTIYEHGVTSNTRIWQWIGDANRVLNGEQAAAPADAREPDAYMTLDCVSLKPASVYLDREDVADMRPDHVVPLYRGRVPADAGEAVLAAVDRAVLAQAADFLEQKHSRLAAVTLRALLAQGAQGGKGGDRG